MPFFAPFRIRTPRASDLSATVPPRGTRGRGGAAAWATLLLWVLALVASPVAAAGTKSARERGGHSGAASRKASAAATAPAEETRAPRHPSEDLQFWLAEKTRTHRPSSVV